MRWKSLPGPSFSLRHLRSLSAFLRLHLPGETQLLLLRSEQRGVERSLGGYRIDEWSSLEERSAARDSAASPASPPRPVRGWLGLPRSPYPSLLHMILQGCDGFLVTPCWAPNHNKTESISMVCSTVGLFSQFLTFPFLYKLFPFFLIGPRTYT